MKTKTSERYDNLRCRQQLTEEKQPRQQNVKQRIIIVTVVVTMIVIAMIWSMMMICIWMNSNKFCDVIHYAEYTYIAMPRFSAYNILHYATLYSTVRYSVSCNKT